MESSKRLGSDIVVGLRAYFKSFRVLREMGLRKSYLLALALTVAFIMIGTWAIGLAVDQLTAVYRDWAGSSAVFPAEAEAWAKAKWWISRAGESVMQFLAFLGFLWLKVKLTKYLVIAFMGPLMAWVSERVEDGFVGRSRGTSTAQVLREFIRGLRSALLLCGTEFCVGAVLFVMTLLVSMASGPISLALSPLLLGVSFTLGAWFYGASVFDFVWERQGKGARAGFVASWHSFGKVLGVGIPFQLWMSIPVISWFAAPVIAPVTCAAAAVIACAGIEIKVKSSAQNVLDLER